MNGLDAGTVVTVGLVVTIALCVAGGIGVVIWLYSWRDSLKKGFDRAVEAAKTSLEGTIQASRRAGDERTDEISKKLDELADRQRDHELSVEQRFMSKDSAGAVFTRLEGSMAEMRNDMREISRQITSLVGRRNPQQPPRDRG
jgi:hypothetical protein